jgi:hypothetical protein
MAANQSDADTSYMAEDYWTRQFREARERAALLDEATVAELVEVYLVSDTDFDLGSMCFEALQRRPHRDLLEATERELHSRRVARRALGLTLLDLATDSPEERDANIPRLMHALADRSPKVVRYALDALSSIQMGASGPEFEKRVNYARGEPREAWPPIVAVFDLSPLRRFVTHRDSLIRMSLAHVYGQCGDTEATDLLLALSRDRDPVVRGSAADELGQRRLIGGLTTECLGRLHEMAAEEASGPRYAAISALVTLAEPGANVLLQAALDRVIDSQPAVGDCHSLVLTLFRRPELISESLRERMTSHWRVDFAAPAPSLMVPHDCW